MTLLIGLIMAALGSGVILPQLSAQLDSDHTVPRLCGVVEHTTHVLKKHSTKPEEKKLPFRHVRLLLYAIRGDAPCCDNLLVVGQTIADYDGRYSFRKTAPGLYWLALRFNDRDYSYFLRYAPAKHADRDCDLFYLNFDETEKPTLNREIVVE
jgi:hypothetical protein